MSGWFRDWLAAGATNPTHTLWLISSNAVEEKPANALYSAFMGAGFAANSAAGLSPDVIGTADFTFANAGTPATFVGNLWTLSGSCPRTDDNLSVIGGTATHKYGSDGATSTENAIVMNKSDAENWNTILQSHPWFDIGDPGLGTSNPPERDFMAAVLAAALPGSCAEDIDPTDSGGDHLARDIPRVYHLAQNVPNPFNPITTLGFELARAGHATLRIYDVAGKLVRTLLDERRDPGRYAVLWNGLDATGRRVPSGVYLYRLVAGDFTATRKMVVSD